MLYDRPWNVPLTKAFRGLAGLLSIIMQLLFLLWRKGNDILQFERKNIPHYQQPCDCSSLARNFTKSHTQTPLNIAVLRESRLASDLCLFCQPKLFQQSHWLICSRLNSRCFFHKCATNLFKWNLNFKFGFVVNLKDRLSVNTSV